MIRRPTWIILAIFAVLLLAAWLWQRSEENKSEEEVEATPTPVAMLLELNPSLIRRLTIEDGQKNRVALTTQDGSTWVMVDAEAQEVDGQMVADVLTQFAGARVLNTLATPPADSAMGMAQPAYVITLLDQGDKVYEVEVGVQTPTQSGYYVRRDGVVYVVSKANLDNLLGMVEHPPLFPTPTLSATQEMISGTLTISPTQTITATP
jgi:hypothetical protein